jgi:hypothetical protein
LQELSKASGVVLLPPGALENLIASKRAELATVATVAARPPAVTPGRPTSPRRRQLLLWGLVLLTLVTLASVVATFFTASPQKPAAESLLGVKVGDPYEAVVDRLKLTHGPLRFAEAKAARRAFLGHVLTMGDSGVTDEDLGDAIVRWSPDESVAVVGVDDRVAAVVIRKGHRGLTGRRLGIGAAVGDVYKAYDDATPRTEPIAFSDEDGGGHGEVRRYDVLGVAFAIHKGKVQSITLYPPRSDQP